jgi:hypothetical protein
VPRLQAEHRLAQRQNHRDVERRSRDVRQSQDVRLDLLDHWDRNRQILAA